MNLTAPLDGVDALSAQFPEAPLSLVVAYSQAVSLKRIADLLESRQGRGELPIPMPAPADPIIQLALQRTDETMRADAARWEQEYAAPVAEERGAIEPPAIPPGFTEVTPGMPTVDPVTGSPVDRNSEVQVLYAGGRKRKAFAGSVAWRNSDPNDPWRPVAYKPLGDGSAMGVE